MDNKFTNTPKLPINDSESPALKWSISCLGTFPQINNVIEGSHVSSQLQSLTSYIKA